MHIHEKWLPARWAHSHCQGREGQEGRVGCPEDHTLPTVIGSCSGATHLCPGPAFSTILVSVQRTGGSGLRRGHLPLSCLPPTSLPCHRPAQKSRLWVIPLLKGGALSQKDSSLSCRVSRVHCWGQSAGWRWRP